MRVVVFTSNAIRHKFVANVIADNASDVLIVSESKSSDGVNREESRDPDPIQEHFRLRHEIERQYFTGHDWFAAKTLPILYKEVNLVYVYEVVRNFGPEMAVVFGASIIKTPLLSLIPLGKFVNLHLGLSPYYRGSGTNFWPFVNEELEYVGATLLHLDAGIDTGDIIAHVRHQIEKGDNVHSVGCKVIRASADCLVKIMRLIENGNELNRVKQWEVPHSKYYGNKDFDAKALSRYKKNLENGLIERYLHGPTKQVDLLTLR